MSHSSFSNLFHSPTTTSTTTTTTPSNSSTTTTLLDSIVATPKHPYCICTHCNHLLTTLSHHHHHPGYGGVEQGTNNNVQSHNHHHQQGTRWSPTPIQLLVLEELYRQGTKTPSAEQIQQIASQLRRFGKIEGKNVFYWFQNHKARERQKRRRREMEESIAASSTKGLKETGCEVKETKKWASTSNCNAGAAGHAFQECIEISSSEKGSNGWNNDEFEERVLRRNRSSERQAKCQNMASYFNIPSTINIAATTSVASQITHNIQLLSTPHLQHHHNNNSSSDARTLELFPVHKNNDHDEGNNGIISFSERKSSKVCATASMEEVISCDQFFEFLPLRN